MALSFKSLIIASEYFIRISYSCDSTTSDSTVYGQRNTIHERGLIACQIPDGIRNILRSCKPTKWHFIKTLLLLYGILEHLLHQRCVDRAGVDRVAPYPLMSVPGGNGLRKQCHRTFG